MTLQKDPEQNESKHLHESAAFSNKRVLEVGCGEGRMTWKYAKATHHTVGIDLDIASLRVAKVDRPYALEHKAHFACTASEYLPFPRETFDIAILAWSL